MNTGLLLLDARSVVAPSYGSGLFGSSCVKRPFPGLHLACLDVALLALSLPCGCLNMHTLCLPVALFCTLPTFLFPNLNFCSSGALADLHFACLVLRWFALTPPCTFLDLHFPFLHFYLAARSSDARSKFLLRFAVALVLPAQSFVA